MFIKSDKYEDFGQNVKGIFCIQIYPPSKVLNQTAAAPDIFFTSWSIKINICENKQLVICFSKITLVLNK